MKIKLRQEPIGIVDIGSNSIRLCVYDIAQRVPVPLFNEKAVCSLGQGLGVTGRLSAEGVEAALATIGRFVALCDAMEVSRLDILATAAVRDATDGDAFVHEVERRFKVEIKVLSGGQEAKMAAMGVLCGTPDANGIVADLGGGSLELVTVQDRDFGRYDTMPLGLLRLAEASGDDRQRAVTIVEGHLKNLPWLKEGKGRNLYAVGGAWRAIARICIAQTQHPLTVLDNFSLDAREALRILDLVSSQSRKSLEKVPGVSRKRVGGLPLAALVLEKVVRAVQPSRLVFSIYGMREGQFFKRLPDKMKAEDPLLAVCRHMAALNSRFPEHGDELRAWMAPLFPNEASREKQLRHAACLLSDIFWNEHPDYRAEQAFLRILRLPFMGVGHRHRAAIAFAIYCRYQGDEDSPLVARAIGLVEEAWLRRARIIGLALRLAHTLSGGAPNLLRQTRLVAEDGYLVLEVPAENPAFAIEIDRSFDRLAKTMNCEALVVRRMG
ncbi:exopolyphosphatase [Paramagnetospirillum kuznetsovii]|uniref:Exopolyphosphatase n=1 Tax=Paramagnetospirillum kuznetsovii TaxID=2053833 RepID=A0A364NVL5_9PROT|nr:Ppx/GppA family phosphatase [Paramagnetospirillum kuznetsovii]RAU21040.1 exopolyphosphatase [Paramagnetospirillum kuznetsovii]